jgi:hypothetical protein
VWDGVKRGGERKVLEEVVYKRRSHLQRVLKTELSRK